MADVNPVGVIAETETKVTPEVSTPAEPVKVGEEQEPQGTETEGELDEHGRKRKGGWQRKIERQAETIEFLTQELLKRGANQPEPKVEPEPEPVAAKTEPKPEDFALGDGTYDIVKFNRAQVDWLWDQKESQVQSKKQAESAKSEEQKIWESWVAKRDEASKKYDDFAEALEVPVLPTDKKKNAFVSKEIQRSEFAGELAYYLGKHPDEARALMNKSDIEIVRGLGRIEAQFARAESADTEKPIEAPVVPPPTAAPKPATPIAKTSTVTKADIHDPKLPWREFVKAREAQTKRK